jgi:hypothetical protein
VTRLAQGVLGSRDSGREVVPPTPATVPGEGTVLAKVNVP